MSAATANDQSEPEDVTAGEAVVDGRSDDAAATKPRSRARRWLKRIGLTLLTLCVLVTLAAWMATRSWFIVWQVKPVLEGKLGGDITIGSATYRTGGHVTFDEITLKARGLAGPAAEIARIGRAEIRVNLASLLTGAVRVDDAELSDITVRVSEEAAQPGHMNFMMLHPKPPTEHKPMPPPPRVRINDLALEVGTHVGDHFLLNGRRRMAGEMHPVEGQESWYAYELAEIDDRGSVVTDKGLFVKGEWNPRTTEFHNRIESIVLDDRVNRMLPMQARLWWNLMNLDGRVDGVIMDWQPDQPLSVRFNVNNVGLTMPVDLGDVWSLYRNGDVVPTTVRPRMNVHSGLIRVGTDSLVLDQLTGELSSGSSDEKVVGVPYEISLNVPRLPAIDWDNPESWMQNALKTSAFELTARLDNFSLAKTPEGDSQAVGLPTIVARTLARFQTTNWVLSTNVRVTRADPAIGTDGTRHAAPLDVSGQAYINHASGKYQKFPYLLEDVDSYLHFDNQRVSVEYLQARGAGGSTFRISGYIEPPDKDASFHIEVTGVNVPLDDRLRDALKPGELQAFDMLFHAPSAESMARGGLLPNQDSLTRLSAQRDALTAQRAVLRRGPEADPAALAALDAQIARLERSIRAGPFVLGGVADVQLTLERELGPQQSTLVRGFIDVKNAGLIFQHFPYPMRGGGRLTWEPDRVTIDPGADGKGGIHFVTAGGGAGTVTGSVAFPVGSDGRRKLQPDLNFAIADDAPSPAIYAAIPYSHAEVVDDPSLASDWPGVALSRAGRIVQGVGLSGAYTYHGHIGSRDDGKLDWDFRVGLDGGAASPNSMLASEIHARDEPWPAGFTLPGLKGEIAIRREAVSWDHITASLNDMSASTTGYIDMRGEGAADRVTLVVDNAPIDHSALNMLSASSVQRAEELWDHFQPQGRMDATIDWRTGAPPGEGSVVTLQPRECSVVLGGERVAVHPAENPGSARINGHGVNFQDLTVDLSCLAAPKAGTFGLRGTWNFAGAQPDFQPGYELTGRFSGGRLESPAIPEALRIFNQDEQATRYLAFHPAGELDLTFDIARRSPDVPLDYAFHIHPQTVEFTLRDTRLRMNIESGEVNIIPGSIALQQVVGRTRRGSFNVDGSVTTTGPLEATLALGYAGRLRSNEVAAFLPDAVNDSIGALDFRDNQPGRLENGFLHLRKIDTGWQTEFTGRLEARDASFVGGVQFTNVDGSLELDIAHETGKPMRMNAFARASKAVALGQDLTDLEAPMMLNEAGDALEIPTAQANAGEGAIAAGGTVGIGDRHDFQARLDLVGLPLGVMLKQRGDDSSSSSVSSSGNSGPGPANTASPGGGSGAGSGGPPLDDHHKPITGQVYGSLTLSGVRDDPASKRGRGIIRVLNGHITSIPLALQAMQVMQLTLPFTGGLDYADAEMYIIGDRAHFERILFESTVGRNAALQLIGEGTLDLRTMEINARFRPRSGVAILRDIVGGISDMLYEIEVTGPLRDPKARIVPLP